MSRASRVVFDPDASSLALAFEEQMEVLGAEPLRVHVEDGELFARALLRGRSGDVLPGDEVRGGVALRTCGADVLVHPFVYRVVCANGQIQGHALGTQRVSRDGTGSFLASPDWVLVQVRDALRAAAHPAMFQNALSELRFAARSPSPVADTDLLLSLTSVLEAHPPLPRLQRERVRELVAQALANASASSERSSFATAEQRLTAFQQLNVVTALARETHNAELRWRLEEFGGAIGARLIVPQPKRGSGALAPVS